MHQQHELRLSTPDEWRLRGIVGAFWESNTLYDQTGWNYTRPFRPAPRTVRRTVPAIPAASPNIGTVPGTTVVNPGVQGDNTSFYQDTLRKTKQTAFFVSVDYDLIPKVLTLTAGTRHFRFDNSFRRQRALELRLLRGRDAANGLSCDPGLVPAGSPSTTATT